MSSIEQSGFESLPTNYILLLGYASLNAVAALLLRDGRFISVLSFKIKVRKSKLRLAQATDIKDAAQRVYMVSTKEATLKKPIINFHS